MGPLVASRADAAARDKRSGPMARQRTAQECRWRFASPRPKGPRTSSKMFNGREPRCRALGATPTSGARIVLWRQLAIV